jgi:transcriptional regulator with XRE-family HTH domain
VNARTRSTLPEKTVSRALGEELRRVREERGWSRLQLVDLLPSGIGDRTLLSYEHGSRNITTVRFIEISNALGVDPSKMIGRGLQRARIQVENLALEIDLCALLHDRNEQFRPMHQWAHNALNKHPSGIVEIEPAVVQSLALFIGSDYLELANYLCRFTPDAD